MEIDSDAKLEISNYVLITSDKKEVRVSNRLFLMSKYLADARINLVRDKIYLDIDIPSEELKHVIGYCEHHNYCLPKEIKKPLLFNDLANCVEDIWDSNFIKLFEYDKLIDLMNASKLLKIESLVDLCYASLAIYFRTTPINVLKKKFFLKEMQFNENELDMIKKENTWISNYGKLN